MSPALPPPPPRYGPGNAGPTTDADWRVLNAFLVKLRQFIVNLVSPPTRTVIAPASNIPFRNEGVRTATLVITTGGTVSAIAISADGINYDSWAPVDPVIVIPFPLGAWVKLTFTVAPVVVEYS